MKKTYLQKVRLNKQKVNKTCINIFICWKLYIYTLKIFETINYEIGNLRP